MRFNEEPTTTARCKSTYSICFNNEQLFIFKIIFNFNDIMALKLIYIPKIQLIIYLFL